MRKLILGLIILSNIPISQSNAYYENSNFIKKIKNLNIDVVAPASSCPTMILQNLSKIKSFNMPKECFVPSASPMPAISDEMRFECLKKAIYNESSDAIWCLRGGYGSARLIEKLAALPKPKKEKFFIGYSDITALHLFFSQEWGWKTIHGAVLREIYEDDKDPENLIKVAGIIAQNKKEQIISDLLPLNESASNTATLKARITGGNLKIIETSIGTNWQIQAKDKILFLEEIGDTEYQIDRALIHLKQASILKDVKAIVFGSFDSGSGKSLELAIRKFAQETKIPIFKSNRFGHAKFNDPIIYHANATISREKKSYSLRIVN